MWADLIFVNQNITEEQEKLCFPGIVKQEQHDDLWKPDILFDGIIDGVSDKKCL